MDRCPSCRARFSGEPECHRCKADLTLLLSAEDQVRSYLSHAMEAYQLRHYHTTQVWLNKIQKLDVNSPYKVLIKFLQNQMNGFWVKTIGDQSDPITKALCEVLVKCAKKIQADLGSGLMLRVYQDSLSRELSLQNISFKRNVSVPVEYKGLKMASGATLSLLVDNRIAILARRADNLGERCEKELLNWMRLGQWPVGILMFFEGTESEGYSQLNALRQNI